MIGNAGKCGSNATLLETKNSPRLSIGFSFFILPLRLLKKTHKLIPYMANKDAKKPDELQEVNAALGKTEAFIEKNLKIIIACVLAVIIIALGVVLFRTKYQAPREVKAQEQIAAGQNYFAVDSFALAINGDDAGYIGFKKIIDEYGSTKTANLAQAYTGISYYRMGDYQNAISYLDKFDANDAMLAPALLGMIGNCYAETGEQDKALDFFNQAANNADNEAITPLFLQKAAEIYELKKDFTKAIEIYNTIMDKYPNSPLAPQMEQRIGRATVLSTQQ
jgi:tetratricopeptide (TPR) repeat protein